MKYCPNCGMPFADNKRFCTGCGKERPADSMQGYLPAQPTVTDSRIPKAPEFVAAPLLTKAEISQTKPPAYEPVPISQVEPGSAPPVGSIPVPGTQRSLTPERPQPRVAPRTMPAVMSPEAGKKKSSTPLIIGGVSVVIVAAVLVMTNMLGLFGRESSSNSNVNATSNRESGGVSTVTQPTGTNPVSSGSVGYLTARDEDVSFTFDRQTVEMFGGEDAFADWLLNVLQLDVTDFYATIYGEYFMSPVEKDYVQRDWFDGYQNAESKYRLQQLEPQNDKADISASDEWPADYLPEDTPEYPDGRWSVEVNTSDPSNTYVYIYISDTTLDSLLTYCESLKDSGWEVKDFDYEASVGRGEINLESDGHKRSWTYKGFLMEETEVYLVFQRTIHAD